MDNCISINFIYIRKKNYLNRKEFAEKENISYGSLSSYEQGISLPPIDVIQRVCKEYGVTIDDFVNVDLSNKNDQSFIPGSDRVHDDESKYVPKESIELYERLIKGKDEIIEDKNEIIQSKNEQILILEKSRVILETIINQINKN